MLPSLSRSATELGLGVDKDGDPVTDAEEWQQVLPWLPVRHAYAPTPSL